MTPQVDNWQDNKHVAELQKSLDLYNEGANERGFLTASDIVRIYAILNELHKVCGSDADEVVNYYRHMINGQFQNEIVKPEGV